MFYPWTIPQHLGCLCRSRSTKSIWLGKLKAALVCIDINRKFQIYLRFPKQALDFTCLP